MAHIERRGPGRWRARYRGPDGKERSRTFDRKVDAERFLVTVESDKLRGSWVDPRLGALSLEEWSARWLATLVHVKPKTLAGYESLLRTCVLPMFGSVPLARIEQPAVAAWVAEMRGRDLSASRTRQAFRVLSGMLDSAVQGGYLAKSPCAGIKLPRMVRRDAVILTAGQVDDLAEAASPYGALIYLLAYGGLRWGEAAALRRRRCDLLRGRLEVAEAVSDVNGHLYYGSTKTYERRWVRIPTFLVELLARQLETVPADPEALVFIGLRGAPLRYQSFRRAIWDRAVTSAGLPEGLTPHHLRHTCASLLVAGGADPVAVQRHLGHKDVSTTLNIYAGLFPNRLEEIAVALDTIYREARSEAPSALGRLGGPSRAG
jgi:integrase